jgi:hypothetical protein
LNEKLGDQKVEEKKDELISGLVDVRERILSTASSLSARELDRAFLGIWSAKDLLAHLAGWDDTNARAMEEILAGELPSFYAHYDKDWATYNSSLVAEYGREDFEEMVALLRETHGKLLDLLSEAPASELWRDRGIRSRGWKVTIGRLLEVEMEDEEEHLLQLKKFVETGETS